MAATGSDDYIGYLAWAKLSIEVSRREPDLRHMIGHTRVVNSVIERNPNASEDWVAWWSAQQVLTGNDTIDVALTDS